jgi:hypothetical protein
VHGPTPRGRRLALAKLRALVAALATSIVVTSPVPGVAKRRSKRVF